MVMGLNIPLGVTVRPTHGDKIGQLLISPPCVLYVIRMVRMWRRSTNMILSKGNVDYLLAGKTSATYADEPKSSGLIPGAKPAALPKAAHVQVGLRILVPGPAGVPVYSPLGYQRM